MEITFLEIVFFSLGFIFLFFLPGYNITREKKMLFPERMAYSFTISSAILLGGTLLLSTTIGMSWLSLVAFVCLSIIATSKKTISIFQSANPL